MVSEFLLSSAVFIVGGFVGGGAAWFARGVIADVQAEDEVIRRRVQARQLRDMAAR
jgi:hypothetical protein